MAQSEQQRNLFHHAWPLMRAQAKDAGIGLALSLAGIAAGLLLPWPMKVIVDSILTDKSPMPAWLSSDKVAWGAASRKTSPRVAAEAGHGGWLLLGVSLGTLTGVWRIFSRR